MKETWKDTLAKGMAVALALLGFGGCHYFAALGEAARSRAHPPEPRTIQPQPERWIGEVKPNGDRR